MPATRKRQRLEQSPSAQSHPKRQKLDTPETIYDNLSKVWLTKNALKELDRRNRCLEPQKTCTWTTQKINSQPIKFAPDFLNKCSRTKLKEIKKLSRLGGPDLRDLVNVCITHSFNMHAQRLISALS